MKPGFWLESLQLKWFETTNVRTVDEYWMFKRMLPQLSHLKQILMFEESRKPYPSGPTIIQITIKRRFPRTPNDPSYNWVKTKLAITTKVHMIGLYDEYLCYDTCNFT